MCIYRFRSISTIEFKTLLSVGFQWKMPVIAYGVALCPPQRGSSQDEATWHPLNLTMAAKIRSNDAIAHDVKKTVTWQV